jgi:hypothetical protein
MHAENRKITVLGLYCLWEKKEKKQEPGLSRVMLPE